MVKIRSMVLVTDPNNLPGGLIIVGDEAPLLGDNLCTFCPRNEAGAACHAGVGGSGSGEFGVLGIFSAG